MVHIHEKSDDSLRLCCSPLIDALLQKRQPFRRLVASQDLEVMVKTVCSNPLQMGCGTEDKTHHCMYRHTSKENRHDRICGRYFALMIGSVEFQKFAP